MKGGGTSLSSLDWIATWKKIKKKTRFIWLNLSLNRTGFVIHFELTYFDIFYLFCIQVSFTVKEASKEDEYHRRAARARSDSDSEPETWEKMQISKAINNQQVSEPEHGG